MSELFEKLLIKEPENLYVNPSTPRANASDSIMDLVLLFRSGHSSVGVKTKMFEEIAGEEKQPNIIIGYNIFTFDIPYMIDRSVLLMSIQDFEKQGMDIVGTAKKKVIEWSSSAYKNQSFVTPFRKYAAIVDNL